MLFLPRRSAARWLVARWSGRILHGRSVSPCPGGPDRLLQLSRAGATSRGRPRSWRPSCSSSSRLSWRWRGGPRLAQGRGVLWPPRLSAASPCGRFRRARGRTRPRARYRSTRGRSAIWLRSLLFGLMPFSGAAIRLDGLRPRGRHSGRLRRVVPVPNGAGPRQRDRPASSQGGSPTRSTTGTRLGFWPGSASSSAATSPAHRVTIGPSRVRGAAAVPLLTATLYYTFSRGAPGRPSSASASTLVLARPRGCSAGALATVPPTAVALMTVNPADAHHRGPRFAADTLATAPSNGADRVRMRRRRRRLLRACLLPARSPPGGAWHGAPRAPAGAGWRRRGRADAGAGRLRRAACARGGRGQVPHDFKSGIRRRRGSGSSRFLSSSRQRPLGALGGRPRGLRDDHLRGSGAGTYQIALGARAPQHGRRSGTGTRSTSRPSASSGSWAWRCLARASSCCSAASHAACAAPTVSCSRRYWRRVSRGRLAAGVDWVWEMPAVTFWLFALGGAALARPAREAAGAAPPGRGAPATRAQGRRRGGMRAVRAAARAARGLPGACGDRHAEHARGRLRERARRGPPVARLRGAAAPSRIT